jgi:hypothetical protein
MNNPKFKKGDRVLWALNMETGQPFPLETVQPGTVEKIDSEAAALGIGTFYDVRMDDAEEFGEEPAYVPEAELVSGAAA